jgi:hypothetical protein
MNWISHLNAVTAIVVSADAASICVSAAFFSERIRSWTCRKRWGSHPASASHLYSVVLADMDDPSGGLMRSQPGALLRNPFDPRAHEASAGSIAPQAHRNHSPRPTFRRSTVLLQRVAAYERTLAYFAPASPELRAQARHASAAILEEQPSPRFESFGTESLQAAQPS